MTCRHKWVQYERRICGCDDQQCIEHDGYHCVKCNSEKIVHANCIDYYKGWFVGRYKKLAHYRKKHTGSVKNGKNLPEII